MNEEPPNSKRDAKGAWLIGAALVTLAVSGYFMGLLQTSSHISLSVPIETPTADSLARQAATTNVVPGIVNYAMVDRAKIGPNVGFGSDVRLLASPTLPNAALTNVTEEERAAALAQRETRRAFDGVPPMVPHPIAQDSSAACLACHGPGLVVKDRVASKMSHAHYSSCTQCHVPSTGPQIPARDSTLLAALSANSFTPAPAPQTGTRAWPGAPPTIPHSTFMRSDCNSCHGPTGLFGLRTPHPDRQSCTQCHAPNAALDQRNFAGAP